jgi:hypothetical protein
MAVTREEIGMKTNLFTPISIKRGDKFVRGFQLTCGKCGFIGKEPVNSIKGNLADNAAIEQQLAQRRFEGSGWFIGGTANQHRCSTCRGIERSAKLFGTVMAVNNTAKPTQAQQTGQAPPPPVMGREDRRVIFEKLNEVYGDDKTGYTGNWTDKLVAEDMNCPRAWVTTVREEMFGPAGGNAVLNEQIAAAREVLANGRKLLTEVSDLKLKIDEQQATINRVMRDTAPLLTLVDRTERIIIDLNKTVRP